MDHPSLKSLCRYYVILDPNGYSLALNWLALVSTYKLVISI